MILGGIWGLKSKVPTLAELLDSLAASIALRAIGAPRVTTKSMLLSWVSLAAMVDFTEGRSEPLT